MAKQRRLDRNGVVAKAAELVDDTGNGQPLNLTMLAAALDIRVPSLYNHIANLEDLHGALAVYAAQLLLARLRSATVGKVGRDALLAMAVAYRRFAQEHPGLYPLTLRAPAPDDTVLTALATELLQLFFLILA